MNEPKAMDGDERAKSKRRPFAPGERVLLFDSKGRRYLVTLAEGGI